jgi:anti-sigma regulatory factor (Ser/Thr protein kinase)
MADVSAVPSISAQVLSERTHFVIPSLPHWIEPTVDFLRQKAVQCGACRETRSGKLMIALVEAISNAMLHGNLKLSAAIKERGDDTFARALAERAADPSLAERVVDIQVDYDGTRCCWTITDQGEGFDVDRVLARCNIEEPDLTLATGRGIMIMLALMDEVRYEKGGRQLILTLNRASGAEKRREGRVPLHVPVRVAPPRPDGSPDLAAATEAISSDWSEGGVALLQERLSAGQRIFIGIPTAGNTVYVPAEVRHVRTAAGGAVQLGCEFDFAPSSGASPPAAAEQLAHLHYAVDQMLAQYHTPALPGAERRSHPRVNFSKVVAIEHGQPPRTLIAYARDLSKGGMALISRVVLPLQSVMVSLPRDNARPLRLRARVVRCNKIEEGFHDVGLQFERLAE